MKNSSKNALLLAGVLLALGGGSRLVLSMWHPVIWGLLAVGSGALVYAIVNDLRTIVDFFSMRTTKHGLNMGALILIALTGLVAVNFLAVRYDKRWDLTSEGLNSLSEQSIKIAEAIKSPVQVVLFTVRENQQGGDPKPQIAELVRMYQDRTKMIELKVYSARQDFDVAKKFDFQGGGYGLYVAQGERKIKVDLPASEETLTKALLKLTREKRKAIYFVTGHDERDIEGSTPEGLGGMGPGAPSLKAELADLYEAKTLSLLSTPSVPDDAAVVAIVGPRGEYAESELAALRAYARRGGRLLVAIDPGQRHNLQLLAKSLGVEFMNDYVLDLRTQVPGQGPVAALGSTFSGVSPITKGFASRGSTLFLYASELRQAPGSTGISFEPLISTDPRTVAVDDLVESAREVSRGPHVVAAYVSGKLPKASAASDAKASAADKLSQKLLAKDEATGKGAKASAKSGGGAKADEPAKKAEDSAGSSEPAESQEFAAVFMGDSDALSNRLFGGGYLNRDFVMNAFSTLAKDDDVVSIRPKSPKASNLQITSSKMNLVFLALLVPLPLLLLASGGVAWWRRRTA